jgi:hypothetical protein
MGELEGAVADDDGGGGRVVVVVRRRLRRRGGLALPGRISLDDLGPGLTRQRRQRSAACIRHEIEDGRSVTGFINLETIQFIISAPDDHQETSP